MHNAARERLSLETELRFALERRELRAFFQPWCALDDHRVVGVEALVRWQHPQRGLLTPADFLSVAEESGMLPAIDLVVLELALQHFVDWQQRLGPRAPQHLNVNVSDRLFAAGDFPQLLQQLLQTYGADPAQLHLEITETVFRGSADVMRNTLMALKATGVKLIVDDFGTGYSSLVSFSESAFDGLKIDRGFIADLESNARHRAIVRTITGFAHDLDLSLVAEGVENEGQLMLLKQLGCSFAQGFYFAPALPATLLEARLSLDPRLDGTSLSI
jgi:EAL domain-containing protein (putative c-di-GMP-specific phosphodiesterase class I)